MSAIQKILVVEDEKPLSTSVIDYLSKSNFLCTAAYDFNEASAQINIAFFDCIILDIGLPDNSGINLIKLIKRKKIESGIIIISARNSLEDRIEGLDIGADDFLVKPFHLSELVSRVNALIRRKKFDGKEVLDYNEISVHLHLQTVYVKDKEVVLTKKEYELLIYFISNSNKILTKDALAYNLWKNNSDMGISSELIYTHIKNLRKKLTDSGAGDYIQAVYGVGYKFAG